MTAIACPELRLDESRARANLQRMRDRAAAAGVRFRPHFKTHQSHAVGRWFREQAIEAITVSSAAMAHYFADDGWQDITIAFPFHPGMHADVEALAARCRVVGITLADSAALDGVRFTRPVDAWVKVDVGSARTGFPADAVDELQALVDALSGRGDLRLRGLLAHAGHSYGARGRTQVAQVHESSLALLQRLRDSLQTGERTLEISIGDTPTCSTQSEFPGAAEIRPGNFIFYDLTQWQIGACSLEDIAVAMACPVVSRHPARGQLVVHGGAVHFSRDAMEFEGERIFGLGVAAEGRGWGELLPDVRLVALSQEHGIVQAPAELIEAVRPGDPLLFLPVHSCLTADAMGAYRLGTGELVEMKPRLVWPGPGPSAKVPPTRSTFG